VTVGDLIEALMRFPDGYAVVIDGYEGGCELVETAEERVFHENANDSDYLGPHDVIPKGMDPSRYLDYQSPSTPNVFFRGVYLPRKENVG
jgi:hypothetical protein